MSVSAVSAHISAATAQPLKISGTLDKPAKDTLSNNSQQTNQTVQSKISAENANNNLSVANSTQPKQSLLSGTETKKTAGVVSHVVVSYNIHGKLRTKFMDSRNNVVYQIPSEMVSKIEDQMMKPETSANIKG
jgi:hypothetical protein